VTQPRRFVCAGYRNNIPTDSSKRQRRPISNFTLHQWSDSQSSRVSISRRVSVWVCVVSPRRCTGTRWSPFTCKVYSTGLARYFEAQHAFVIYRRFRIIRLHSAVVRAPRVEKNVGRWKTAARVGTGQHGSGK